MGSKFAFKTSLDKGGKSRSYSKREVSILGGPLKGTGAGDGRWCTYGRSRRTWPILCSVISVIIFKSQRWNVRKSKMNARSYTRSFSINLSLW